MAPIFFFFFLHVSFPATEAHTGGFSIELIHRDSPNSPFYDPSATTLDRLKGAFRRSISRADHFKTKFDVRPDDIQSEIVPTRGEYLTKLSIGTPPVEILAIADTGSDLTWTQCQPCTQCFNQTAPLFDTKQSSTYRDFSCSTSPCSDSQTTTSCGDDNTCQYQLSYGDQSFSYGNLASETFTFGGSLTGTRPVSFPTVTFGCGHNDGGTFNEATSGIIGLGGGPVSIIRQLSGSVGGKFSYCLISDPKATSKINFGDSAVVSGDGVVSTPIVKKSEDTFYYLTLESVGLGNTTLPFKKSVSNSSAPAVAVAAEDGNIIIDSGTTLTILPSDFYQSLEGELVNAIHGDQIQEPSGTFGLCYKSGSVNIGDIPTITFSFVGADLELPPLSTFVQVGELVCFAMVSAGEQAIFGNLAQMNFLIGYDLVNNQVSFKPTDCTEQ